MQALPAVFCEDGGKTCFPVITAASASGEGTSRSQPTWLKNRRMSCHFPQQVQAAGLEGFVPLQTLPDLSD